MKWKLVRNLKVTPTTCLVCAILLLGALLRLYHFEGFVGFLGDQGRDAIVIKRIATAEHFPGIGASSSVGNVFLGPFFYYFSAPWLLLSGFDPIGPAYGVALTWIGSLAIMYVMLRRFFSEKVAIVSLFLMATSYSMVWLSRFAWNPNLMPVTSILAVVSFWEARRSRSLLWYGAFGALLSISMQMHYVALALCLPMGIFLVKDMFYAWKRSLIREELVRLVSMVGGWVVCSLPLILFEVQNRFMNLRGILDMLVGSENRSSGRPPLEEISYTFSQLFYHAFRFDVSHVVSVALLFACVIVGLYAYRKRQTYVWTSILFFLTTLLLTSFFTQVKNLHYLGVLYPLLYVIAAQLFVWLSERARSILVLVVFCLAFLSMQKELLSYFKYDGSFLIRRAQNISQKIYDESDTQSIQITSLPDHYGDYMYRYFMEVWGKRPVERASLIKADELFVVCEEECKPIGDPQWDIAYFEPREIVGTWEVEDVTIYKLIR